MSELIRDKYIENISSLPKELQKTVEYVFIRTLEDLRIIIGSESIKGIILTITEDICEGDDMYNLNLCENLKDIDVFVCGTNLNSEVFSQGDKLCVMISHLSKTNIEKLTIQLHYSNLTDDGVSYLNSFKEHPTLRELTLYLGGNHLTDKSLNYISDIIKVREPSTLKRLHLNSVKTDVTHKGVIDICNSLSINNALIYTMVIINSNNDELRDKCKDAISHIKTNCRMKGYKFADNNTKNPKTISFHISNENGI